MIIERRKMCGVNYGIAIDINNEVVDPWCDLNPGHEGEHQHNGSDGNAYVWSDNR